MDRLEPTQNQTLLELLTDHEFVVLKNEHPGIAYNLDYEYSYITDQFPSRTSI